MYTILERYHKRHHEPEQYWYEYVEIQKNGVMVKSWGDPANGLIHRGSKPLKHGRHEWVYETNNHERIESDIRKYDTIFGNQEAHS